VETTESGGATIVAVDGDVDLATVPQLRTALLGAAAAGDGRPLVIDLTAVTFMDSSGLAVLLATTQAARERGRPFAIVCPEGPARLLLAVTGLDGELPLHGSRAEALASVG
jgi:anti-anti-sigma factor